MKKAFFLLLLPLLMWSCAQDDAPLMPDAEAPAEAIASHIRSAADVLGIAAKAAEMKAPTSRSGEVRVDAKSLFAIHANDSRSDSSDPLMYAVDFEDNEGFVIISALRTSSLFSSSPTKATTSQTKPAKTKISNSSSTTPKTTSKPLPKKQILRLNPAE